MVLIILQSFFEMINSQSLNLIFVRVSYCEKFIPFSSVNRTSYKHPSSSTKAS